MKLSNLMDKDFTIVDKKKNKIWFIIPACIVGIAIIAMIIWGTVTGSALNLGMDFTGGYAITVQLNNKLPDDAAYETYRKEIIDTIENLTDDEGNSYNLKVADTQKQGEGGTASIRVEYRAVASDEIMEDEINPAIQQALEDRILKIVPTVKNNNGAYTLTYSTFPLAAPSNYQGIVNGINELAEKEGVTVSDIALSENKKEVTFNASGSSEAMAAFDSSLSAVASIDDSRGGRAIKGEIVSARMSTELLTNAMLAISLAIVLMLVYIAFRFEVSSGLSAIAALVHDVIIMFSFMAICHIPVTSTFIAALITILGYSINNTIIVFDRIRENTKSVFHKNSTATFIANESIKSTLMRSINTSITTLLTITMVAIIGVQSIRWFALPIIVGLLAGTYSSIFISPTIWAMWKDRKKKALKSKNKKSVEGKTEAIA